MKTEVATAEKQRRAKDEKRKNTPGEEEEEEEEEDVEIDPLDPRYSIDSSSIPPLQFKRNKSWGGIHTEPQSDVTPPPFVQPPQKSGMYFI